MGLSLLRTVLAVVDVDVLEADLLAQHHLLLVEVPPAAVQLDVGNAVLGRQFFGGEAVSSDCAFPEVEAGFGGEEAARLGLLVLHLCDEGGFARRMLADFGLGWIAVGVRCVLVQCRVGAAVELGRLQRAG